MSRDAYIEKQWTTCSGLQAIVVAVLWEQDKLFRWGYVEVPVGHPLYKKHCHEVAPYVDVHGGLSFAGSSEELGIEGSSGWWFGFDASPGYGIIDRNAPWRTWYGLQHEPRQLEYVAEQCEYLAWQLRELGEMWAAFLAGFPIPRAS
ncbi:hypothetical protein HRbin16_02213 [bacterium HR16]|nr:hypothetical protein HRbin16_02213 [bacterium HR16]